MFTNKPVASNNDFCKSPVELEKPWTVDGKGGATEIHKEMHFEAKKLSNRELTISELITTEITYLHNMHKFHSQYILPMMLPGNAKKSRSIRGSISMQVNLMQFREVLEIPPDVQTLLRQVKTILPIHEDFLLKLKKINEMHSDEHVKFGQTFLNFFPMLKIYAVYYKLYKSGENYFSERDDGYDVMQLMSNPIQRPPRYLLLLKEIIKRTDEDHVDYKSLVQAKSVIADVVESLNMKLKQDAFQATTQRIILAELRLPDLLQPARVFKTQAQVSLYRGEETPSKHTLYLFNDLLVIKKNAKIDFLSGGEVKEQIKLSPRTVHYSTDPKNPDTLIITYFDNEFDMDSHKTLTVKFSNGAEQRQHWESILRGFRDRTISRYG